MTIDEVMEQFPVTPGASQGRAPVRRPQSRSARAPALMRILFDNGTPRGVARGLPGHTVEEARSHGWDSLRNGELPDAAEAAGFELFLTTDRNIRYPQNVASRKIAIVVLSKGRWRIIRTRVPAIAAAVNAATPGSFAEVEIPVD